VRRSFETGDHLSEARRGCSLQLAKEPGCNCMSDGKFRQYAGVYLGKDGARFAFSRSLLARDVPRRLPTVPNWLSMKTVGLASWFVAITVYTAV
jgi:hypothetical protein